MPIALQGLTHQTEEYSGRVAVRVLQDLWSREFWVRLVWRRRRDVPLLLLGTASGADMREICDHQIVYWVAPSSTSRVKYQWSEHKVLLFFFMFCRCATAAVTLVRYNCSYEVQEPIPAGLITTELNRCIWNPHDLAVGIMCNCQFHALCIWYRISVSIFPCVIQLESLAHLILVNI